MLLKSRSKIPSSLNNCIKVMLLMLLIVQIMMILRNESMKIKWQFRLVIILKAAGWELCCELCCDLCCEQSRSPANALKTEN